MVLLMSEDMNVVMRAPWHFPALPVLLLQVAEIRNIPQVIKNCTGKSGNSRKLTPSLITWLVHIPIPPGNKQSTGGDATEGVFTYSY